MPTIKLFTMHQRACVNMPKTAGQRSAVVRSLALLFVALLPLSGCETTTAGGAVGVDRKQLMLVSSAQMNQIAAQTYTKLVADGTTAGAINKNTAQLTRVRGVARRIAPQTGIFRADAPAWPWEVNVQSSDSLNAFCMPGGKIMFYSGLIDKLKLTDAEIAIVMGHEIAHALREHSREQMSQALAAQTTIGAGAVLLGLGQASADLAAIGYQTLVATRFSRNDEAEADRLGLELSARAGYDPRAGLSLWNKMLAANPGGRPPEFLSSHPAEATRVAQIEALLPTVMPLYQATR
jgi:predicted Zn-dependent protease